MIVVAWAHAKYDFDCQTMRKDKTVNIKNIKILLDRWDWSVFRETESEEKKQMI